MSAFESALRGGVRVLERTSQPLAADALVSLFMRVGRKMPLREADRATMDLATRSTVRIPGLGHRGTAVQVYEWGRGSKVVVLAHGWQGRASQFATLVRDLRYEGYRVVAFDAPAHGESDGRATYLVDWIDTLHALQQRYGALHAVAAHSLGALATLVAVREGLDARKVVSVAAPADSDALFEGFQHLVGCSDATVAAMKPRFHTRYFPREIDPFVRLYAARHPLPASTELLVVHGRRDARVPVAEAARLVAVNPRARMLHIDDLGHTRILTADPFLDATLAFLGEPAWTVDLPMTTDRAVDPRAAVPFSRDQAELQAHRVMEDADRAVSASQR